MNNELSIITDVINASDNSEEILCTLVYHFAKNLPYSMDYKDPNFVLGDYMNFVPVDPKKYMFIDYGSLYNKMIHWSDTIVTGVKLQVCSIFQKMLMSINPDKYQLDEEDFYLYGFDKLTGMEIYNKNVFNLLIDLPKYCRLVNSTDVMEERRKHLKTVYEIIDKVTSHVEYVRRHNTEVCTDIVAVREEKVDFIHGWSPEADLNMMYHFNNINISNCYVYSLIEQSNSIVLGQLDCNDGLKLD